MITNFKNKKITVMGLGLHGGGEGLVRFLSRHGAKVKVTDLKNKDQLRPTLEKLSDLKINYNFGNHRWSDFANSDIVFVNPAVPKNSLWLKKIKAAQIPTSTETNLFFSLCQGQIIGVTGTNGKSTTTTLIYEIFKRAYLGKERKVFLGGNIGLSLLNNLEKIKQDDIIIMELSSFQLQDLAKIYRSPHVGAMLNLSPDHLDAHKNFEEYINAKMNIFKFQTNSDFAVLNFDSSYIREKIDQIPSRKFYFSRKKELDNGVYLNNNNIIYKWRGMRGKVCSLNKIKLIGKHNLENILASVAVAILYQIKPSKMVRSIYKFQGLEHRLEFVRDFQGVKYYNDSKATTPESTIAALKSFSDDIILLAGGSEKNINFQKLALSSVKRVKALILFGQTSKSIAKACQEVISSKTKFPKKLITKQIYQVNNIYEAMPLVKKIAKVREVVLLSPACASFDQFSSYEERGKIYKKLVWKLNG